MEKRQVAQIFRKLQCMDPILHKKLCHVYVIYLSKNVTELGLRCGIILETSYLYT